MRNMAGGSQNSLERRLDYMKFGSQTSMYVSAMTLNTVMIYVELAVADTEV